MLEQSPAWVPAQARAQPVMEAPVKVALAAVVPPPVGNDEREPNLIQPMFSLQAYPDMVRSSAMETPYVEPEREIQPMVSLQAYPVSGVPVWASTVQLGYVYEPERVPLVQVRVSEVQLLPYGTEEVWYAVTEEPLVTVLPSKVQEAKGQLVGPAEPPTVTPLTVPLT